VASVRKATRIMGRKTEGEESVLIRKL